MHEPDAGEVPPGAVTVLLSLGSTFLPLYISGVLSVVQGHGQAAGLSAGLFNAPHRHGTDGAPDGLPVQLGFKHE